MTMRIIIDGVAGTWTPDSTPEPPEPPPRPYNAAAFFNQVRQSCFGGSLKQSQVDGINTIGEYLMEMDVPNMKLELAAYLFATFQWETASTMRPIEEYGGKKARYAPWYGRGYVQLTWESNYRKQQDKLRAHPLREQGVPYRVHDDPNLALNPHTSALISIYGCLDGDFTGKKLSDYIKPGSVDYVNARRVVNGTDRANEIADYAKRWERALRAGFEHA